MKDFPVFTTENGAASLILKEVPYRSEAFIRILDSMNPAELLSECISFCQMCGAKHIYATGDPILEKYALHTTIFEMKGIIKPDECLVENLWPVTESTVSKWRAIYNGRMKDVDNAGTLEERDEKRIVESGGAYFVHRSGELLGIGWIEQDRIEVLASTQKGSGRSVLHTLLSIYPGKQISLQVASTNHKAISLYERVGFIKTAEISKWYCVK